eukprot:5510349-Pleurochrysis_carterae.AAC.2
MTKRWKLNDSIAGFQEHANERRALSSVSATCLKMQRALLRIASELHLLQLVQLRKSSPEQLLACVRRVLCFHGRMDDSSTRSIHSGHCTAFSV